MSTRSIFPLFAITVGILAVAFASNIYAATIDVYVSNISGTLVQNASVKLYNSSWGVISTKSTDENGYVRFASLDYGTYHYEVRYSGDTTEFWGSDENISLQQPLINRYFTRKWPYKSGEQLPANPYVGQQVQLSITVKNNLSYSRNAKVELWVDRSKSSSWDFYELSAAQTVSANGGTRTFTFNITPGNSGSYYWKAYVRTWNDGSGAYIVTDTIGWGTAFSASYQTAAVDIYAENVSGARVQGCEVALDGDSNTTDSNGRARFTSVRYGDYNYEVYFNGTGTREFWGNKTISVDSSSESDTFRRNWPYKSSQSIPGNPTVGQPLQIQVTARNNLSFARDVKVELWVDRDQGITWDFYELSASQSVDANGGTRTFLFDVLLGSPGLYYWKAHIKSYNDGAGAFIVTDTTAWGTAFTVQGEALPNLTGRVAFHRDSNNTSLHTPSNSDDGHIYVLNLNGGNSPSKVTFGLPLGNAMNPHFSPDGSKITFMAIPSGNGLLWANMHVYMLDLAEDDLIDLGSGQDPKFSPDGDFIVFKKNSQIYRMHSDGSSATALTSTIGEKSGPNYSPDGTKIVYWLNGGDSADIWLMNADGSGAASTVANVSIQDYYPIYRDADNILYARWDSAAFPHPDKVYNIELSSGTSTKLGLNSSGTFYEDADAFPFQDLVGFSSTRKNGWPDYDIYVAADAGSPFGELSSANSTLGELGGVYSACTYSRKLKMQAPANGATLTTGVSHTLEVRAYSDGSTWTGASPTVTFTGPSTVHYTDLKDDGTQGDGTPGDGIYSKAVLLPATPGRYSVSASAQSVEPGVSRQVVSRAVAVEMVEDETLKGDINNDEIVTIEDAILGLRILSGFQPQEPINLLADVDDDGKIGMEEVIYILQKTSGLRQ